MPDMPTQARQVLTVLKVFRQNLVRNGDRDLALACIDLSDLIETWLEHTPTDDPTPQVPRPQARASGGWVRSDGSEFKLPTTESDGGTDEDELEEGTE